MVTDGETVNEPRILALCAGYGGLEDAITAVIGGAVVAYAETHPAAARVLAVRHPRMPNIGDITAADWHGVMEEHMPDVIGAGFPCQDISVAGHGEGISGERSGIWKNVAEAVGIVRPRLVFLENVAVIRGRGLDVVAGDLAAHGYDLRWTCLRADKVGGPHQRNRWFGLARPAENANGAARG